MLLPLPNRTKFDGENVWSVNMATTVTADDQVMIPKVIQEFLGIGPGSVVDFKQSADGSIILVPEEIAKPTNRFERFRGHAGPGLSTDEVMALTRGEI